MIDLFEKCFGVPYPWDKYDQILAKNFNEGGMENTSATTLYPTAVLDKAAMLDGDLDGLISHELCHQWTGDYITCKSWAHIWLNEGWATYGDDLWQEQRFGTDGYLDAMRGEFSIAHGDRTSTNDTPMVSTVYGDADEVFGRAANPYPKGASILHMLRMMLGDEVFWKGVRLYFQQHGLGLAETNDFRYAMEEVSGRGLEWFFEQWCYRPGTPEVEVKTQYDAATRALTLDIEQKQKIDEKTPAFRFTLPVVARTAGGDKTLMIDVDTKATSFRTVLDGPPTLVAVDPNLHVLKTLTEDKPLAWWVEQAKAGPTIVAREQAVEALGKSESPDNVALLVSIIKDEKERHTLRNVAVDALSKYGSASARQAMLDLAKSGVPEARVRVNLVEQLRNADRAVAVDALAKYAGSDASPGVRTSAISGLAALKAKEQVDLIASLVDFDSRNDEVRNAALRALADLDDARGLDFGMKYAAYGHHDRSRPTAINVVGRLAGHDKDRAVDFLIKMLDDPEARTVNAAGAALADIGDMKAEPRLQAMSESDHDPAVRERAKGWLEALRKKKG
jgi:aminopeptidase N